MALLCYGLLLIAWIVDLLTPQMFIVAILFNAPIALSSLTLQSRLTTRLVVASEIANAVAGYYDGIIAGHNWSAVAIGDRLLLAASFVLVGYLSIKTQEFGREAGLSAGRMRQVEIEKALRQAIGSVRETLNLELVQRAVTRQSVALLGATKATLIVRETSFGTPLTLSYTSGERDISVERRPLTTEVASLAAHAAEVDDVLVITKDDALGRLTLDALGAEQALATAIRASGSVEYVLIECIAGTQFGEDAAPVVRAFAQQAGMALGQAALFTQLGEQSEENVRQKNELADRGDVIRDIVSALAHDLRTPLTAAHVTMSQALNGAYGVLPDRYQSIVRTALAANDDQRRIVETLLLVARYEAGEASSLNERVACDELALRIVEELQPVADVKGVAIRTEIGQRPLSTRGDPHEIRRAIANLVANAIDATPRGGHIIVGIHRIGTTIAIAVDDDGYGVAPERRAGLFQRFAGGHPGAGSGLGLYIVRRIAEKHGGSAQYAPRSPAGSTFTMTLPAIEE
ncbi:MAG TPA: HAMP domain-containing sensor histidine kinase [Candidatus Cybelea sp.]|nr:HAMP domain-containing sensor histidine kinase [Candidatus Cybelea sp.]